MHHLGAVELSQRHSRRTVPTQEDQSPTAMFFEFPPNEAGHRRSGRFRPQVQLLIGMDGPVELRLLDRFRRRWGCANLNPAGFDRQNRRHGPDQLHLLPGQRHSRQFLQPKPVPNHQRRQTERWHRRRRGRRCRLCCRLCRRSRSLLRRELQFRDLWPARGRVGYRWPVLNQWDGTGYNG